MQLLKSLTAASYQDLIDYNVVDANGEHIGTLHSLWSDQDSGQIEFLGVKTGWLFGKNHVVPASDAQLDLGGKFLKLPYPTEFIKNAPSIDADSEITEAQEQQIFSYYRNAAAAGTAASAASSTTGADLTTSAARSDMERGLGVTAGTVGTMAGDSGRLRRTTGSFGVSSSGGVGSGISEPPAAARSESGMVGGDANPDPITGEPGAHPIGTGIGAASGAATGAAMGAIGGPVGAVVGGVAGAVVGGLIGKGVEEYFDPTVESAYWRSNYQRTSYYDPAQSFDVIEPAYRTGYEGFGRLAQTGRTGEFHTVETDLQSDYDRARGETGLAWDKAKPAVRDAYERVRTNVTARSSRP